jgi:hemoglobin
MTSDFSKTSGAPGAIGESEDQISHLVELFYSRVQKDDLIGPVFERVVRNWDHHHDTLKNFWCTQLLGTGDYPGNGFVAHQRLPLEEEHFTRWLTIWEQTVPEVLPPALAQRAIGRARHMANQYKTGLLPYKRPDGRLSRTPN